MRILHGNRGEGDGGWEWGGGREVTEVLGNEVLWEGRTEGGVAFSKLKVVAY